MANNASIQAEKNFIAKNANKQMGVYSEVNKALKEFSKQLKESEKASKQKEGGASGGGRATNPYTAIQKALTTQTAILRDILKQLKSMPGIGSGGTTLNGQQKEMAEVVKKTNQVKGKVGGELKLAPSTITELTSKIVPAQTKATEAATKKHAAAARTQQLARSFTEKKQKGTAVKVAGGKGGGNILNALKKILPHLLTGLKKLLTAILSPGALIAMFISRFLPYIILGIAFLYGVWQGIKDYIVQIWDDIPDLLKAAWQVISDVIWDGLVWITKKIIDFGDWLTDKIAEGLFYIYEGFCKWWDQLVGIIDFCIDWVKDAISNWVDMVVEIFTFCKDWIVGKITAIYDAIADWCNKAVEVFKFAVDWVCDLFTSIKNTVVGFFTKIWDKITGFFGGIKDKIANSWLGKKLGLGSSDTVTNNNSSVSNTTNVTNKGSNNDDALKDMTKKISAPMNQMTKLVENQGLMLKKMNMTPVRQDASFNTNMTPMNGNIMVSPNDSIESTLVQQTVNIANTQQTNNKELANAFNSGIDRLVQTMNDNYAASLVDRQNIVVPGS